MWVARAARLVNQILEFSTLLSAVWQLRARGLLINIAGIHLPQLHKKTIMVSVFPSDKHQQFQEGIDGRGSSSVLLTAMFLKSCNPCRLSRLICYLIVSLLNLALPPANIQQVQVNSCVFGTGPDPWQIPFLSSTAFWLPTHCRYTDLQWLFSFQYVWYAKTK